MVGMIVELQVLVGVAFLEVVLRCVGLGDGSFHRAVVTAESFAVHIVVIVRSVVRHPKCSIIFFDCLQLLTIFNIIVHIYCVSLFAGILYAPRICAVGCEVTYL